ncbi:MAG: T9SS type A sorting domain-containing protein [Bacteroidetes bacterium]|nr:T9SS type A sorting domain-containing protein [Bacteroidota bacterium]
MYLNCLASEKTPFFIFGNVFQGTGSTTGIGLVSNKISGDFRYNSFLTDDYITSVNLLQSDLNFFENSSMKSGTNSTLIVNSTSSARLAPVYSSGNYYWYGGYNKLFSNDLNNVYIVGTSSAFLDKGGNCFTIYNSNYYHVKSALTGSCNSYGISASENYWSAIPPLNHLICNSDTVDLFYQPYNTYCENSKPEPFDYDIIDRGDGIYDTIAITEGGDFMNGDGEDESMFGQALMSKRNKNFTEAIELLKTVINNYDTSDYLPSSIDELYTNYQNKDTSSLQLNTDILFGDLKQYLESKITQHANNYTIVDKAYSYYLMCLTKMDDYDEAIVGYENIMSNHPEPERRLLASWDRSALTLLQNGSGQGDNDSFSESRNEKNVKDKPVHSIAKTNFKNSDNYSDLNSDQNSGSKFSNDSYRKVLETKIIKYNPSNQTELDKKITEDLNFLLGLKTSEITETQNIKVDKFQLNQNYPNPFNPSTKIAYSIPVSGNISIKIYDLTGKEVKTLVNEFKNAGIYSIEFNGSGLSSGVYFYTLNVKEIYQIKKNDLNKINE